MTTPPTPQSGDGLDDKTPQMMHFVNDHTIDFTYQGGEELDDAIYTIFGMYLSKAKTTEECKDRIKTLIHQSQAAAVNTVLDRVERKVIGQNSIKHAHYCDLSRRWDNSEDVSCSCEVEFYNELRAKQRQALQKLRQEHK